ncbi:MotA/TolQ/ExbB proton channel family protein [Vibrio sp. ZSDE26]|uniref:MotA/TolQ/ExbB proton channel family protein n=1 Tax=Vibrio amylolyticus TaxID=2847292 RepID=A0A9X1XKN1_9VIBR|nr:MotA/TolQ/ExbB proton channel family protein [Vibrio amylolyticus]MCK6264191.1 MotA/TolQ/ExbB proton channel family protein [Vibrio amylolyticus]
MTILNSIHSQLGVMTWPLTVMSFLVIMILLERTLFLIFNSKTNGKSLLRSLSQIDFTDSASVDAFSKSSLEKSSTLDQGVGMLLAHQRFDKPLREEAVTIWLQKKRQSYISGLKILSIIGVISPLVGLLGTVIGLIEMFKSLGASQGSIEPALLADGLGLAMSTTAAGLLIALPAITGAQLFHLWADNTLSKIELGLNHCNLLLEGVSFETAIEKKDLIQSSRNSQCKSTLSSTVLS